MIRIIEWFIEVIGWVRIVLSPTFIGLILAAVCYFKLPQGWHLYAAIPIALTGLLLGIRLANRKWRTGTINFLSGVKEEEPQSNEF